MSMRDDEAGDRARAEAEELAWRQIVDHYGDQPDLAGLIELTTPLEQPEPEPWPDDEGAAAPFGLDADDEEFVPPPLPPPAVISPERRVAWVGLVAAPVLLVLINLLDYSLPGILSVGLVIAFIASFGYLVATMAPRDPDDDGARL
ncbi:MAG: hypothetical protein QM747_18595 [Nocardioides sp.]